MTGGAGFIGSLLVHRLIAQGHQVVVLDNLATGRRANLSDLVGNRRFGMRVGDVRDAGAVSAALVGSLAVVHLAALVDVRRSFDDEKGTREVNVAGTKTVVNCCKDLGVKTIIFASSSSVYGDLPPGPTSEETALNPLSPYARSKADAESLCNRFIGEGRRSVSLRLFNVYGGYTGKTESPVIERFVSRIRIGRPPIIFGDGSQTRDFVHVTDVANAAVAALTVTGATGPINVGSGVSHSINDVADKLLSMMKRSDLKPIYRGRKKGDILHSLANIQRARRTLKYVPRIALDQGLRMLVSA